VTSKIGVFIKESRGFKPFVKWAGGKRGLLPELLKRVPKKFNNYFEPFVGGGALFFEMKNLGMLEGKKVYLLDKNSELINTYKTIQNSPQELINHLKEFQKNHSKEFYYETREMDRVENFKSLDSNLRAARFIYLNKTCFNGLHRVNSKGFFNVPMGRYKNPKICDEELVFNSSLALQNVEILHSCYSKVLEFAGKNDFVYFDPPYYPLSATSSFTAYGEDIFLDNEQRELFEVFRELDKRECFVVHSNSDTEFIKNLYREYKIEFVEMERFINSKSSGRGKIREVIMTNHKKRVDNEQ